MFILSTQKGDVFDYGKREDAMVDIWIYILDLLPIIICLHLAGDRHGLLVHADCLVKISDIPHKIKGKAPHNEDCTPFWAKLKQILYQSYLLLFIFGNKVIWLVYFYSLQ